MLRIGLTGGIGSGKSTVAQLFEMLGIPVYYADTEAKRLMNEDAELRKKMAELFGENAYPDGQLNRHYISSVVFNDPAKLGKLNSLVHPLIKKEAETWMRKQITPYAIHEAALIFEAGVNERLDYVIGVSAPEELRVQRTMERDRIKKEDVIKRMQKQLNEDEKIKRCDFIIYNDEEHLLIPQVNSLHEQLLLLLKATTP